MAVPAKCQNLKFAQNPATHLWCEATCGTFTGGRMCHWWCMQVERSGWWTLIFTIVLPIGTLVALVALLR